LSSAVPNGGWPSSAAYSVAPREYTSDANTAPCPDATSGERNAGVPTTTRASVTVPSPIAREMPKSTTFAVPSSATRTLNVVTSRCTIPAACAAANAEATCHPTPTTSASGSGPRSSIISASVFDGTYSMTRHGVPPCSTTSCTVTTCGCRKRAAIRPSRTIRSTASGDPLAVKNLTATTRANRSSWARQTTPAAPRPSCDTRR
jgi:hypothetical protein